MRYVLVPIQALRNQRKLDHLTERFHRLDHVRRSLFFCGFGIIGGVVGTHYWPLIEYLRTLTH